MVLVLHVQVVIQRITFVRGSIPYIPCEQTLLKDISVENYREKTVLGTRLYMKWSVIRGLE
jgi:hypothetical protein